MNVTDIDDKIIIRSREQGADFAQFARKWENEFFSDMKALGVKMPDAITRVSEFIPDIITYIEQIIKNGYGYASNGSVYFDIEAFKKSPKHTYAKLDPGSMSDPSKYLEGEGALGVQLKSEKKNPFDFALWKKSKEGEPKWTSPWYYFCNVTIVTLGEKDVLDGTLNAQQWLQACSRLHKSMSTLAELTCASLTMTTKWLSLKPTMNAKMYCLIR